VPTVLSEPWVLGGLSCARSRWVLRHVTGWALGELLPERFVGGNQSAIRSPGALLSVGVWAARSTQATIAGYEYLYIVVA